MNFVFSLIILITWVYMIYWFKENTCVLNNHEFIVQKKRVVCKKCGLIKMAVKND